VVHFEEVEVMGGGRGGGEKNKEGERKLEKVERDEKERLGWRKESGAIEGWRVSRFTWLKMNQLRGSTAGGRQRFCVCLCLVGPGLPRCLQQLSFCGSLHCVIVGEVADTVRWREICAGMQQLESLCLHILWVQALPDAYRSLPFSVLCFGCTDPSRKELREKGK
jgi:hypothetical protein